MTIVMDIINEQREKKLAALEAKHAEDLEDLTAENEALELEVKISRETIKRFLDGDAPTFCDQCDEPKKLYNMCGILACPKCKRGWDPRDGWTWTEWK